jgi:hypothetical protein
MKQVDTSHYDFQRYMSKERWSSIWHQVDEVVRLSPQKVLEVGPGKGVFKYMMLTAGYQVETLDVDPELEPDHVGSVTNIPLADNSYDVTCAFQVLEHLPYDQSLLAFAELARVSSSHIVVSMPDAQMVWRYLGYIPKIGGFDTLLRRPFAKMKLHSFDGEHYWEINKKDYPLSRIIKDFSTIATLEKTYRVNENPYHRFFIYKV